MGVRQGKHGNGEGRESAFTDGRAERGMLIRSGGGDDERGGEEVALERDRGGIANLSGGGGGGLGRRRVPSPLIEPIMGRERKGPI